MFEAGAPGAGGALQTSPKPKSDRNVLFGGSGMFEAGASGAGGASNIAPPQKTTKTSKTEQYQTIWVGERPLPPLGPA